MKENKESIRTIDLGGEKVADESVQCRNKKRLLKKAPDAPKRFKSAYICYVTKKMDEIKEESARDIKATDVMKKLAILWQDLSPADRLIYEITAEADKARYFEEMARYTGPMHVPNKRVKKSQGAPKRAISSFLSFSQQMRPEIRALHPNMTNTDVSSILAQKWHEASDEDKRPHIERGLKDREKYHEDMAAWKEGENERIEADKAQAMALKEGGPSSLYLNQLPSSTLSLLASIFDVGEGATEEGVISNLPVYDESMAGFWDTEMEGGENQFGCSAISDSAISDRAISETAHKKSSVKEEKLPLALPSVDFNIGSQMIKKESKKKDGDVPLTAAKKAKGDRIAKRAKLQREREIQYSNFNNTLPLTSQQLDIQERRMQQQQQYQMYQQHVEGKQRLLLEGLGPGLGSVPAGGDQAVPPPQREIKEWNETRVLISPKSIVEGGRLHSQAQANKQMAQTVLHQQQQSNTYQGVQRSSLTNTTTSWGLASFLGQDEPLSQYPPTQDGSYTKPRPFANRPSPSNSQQYFGQNYGQSQSIDSNAYGMESMEKSFFDELLGQDNTNSFQFADRDNQGLVNQLDGLVHGMSGTRHSSSQEVHRGSGVGVEGSQGLNLNRNFQNKSTGQLSSQVIQAPNFDEQDRFSVMQTLLDVHNSTAKSSDEVHRTTPREVQEPKFKSVMSTLQEKRGYPQMEQDKSTQLINQEKVDLMETMNDKHLVGMKEECLYINKNDDNSNVSEISTGEEDLKHSKEKKIQERLFLKERQLKQMQDMLLLQEKEWADLEEVSSSSSSSSVSLVTLPP
mmetsp:Transcript_9700/g.9484  ORF Transcript_9700/g.9484 Transcript_9700/m.9484 type:complete len:797 (+) Transcript_9700:326-2716(+)|eukprot:CAMPEP_0119053486 /NCGR_PEP_ID=MMETSP1177-20130426/74461_1 /TAXON_ID=2985 /ORGANISM="Ochromonas sp, Strain CCMP1899" /LENGTH=796 /DNA_ID=CAMNT_0007033455 /DNA_START=326 /DNA_END=2716 /DNA_ORIENTATION=-